MKLITNKTGSEVACHFTGTESITIPGAAGVSNIATDNETVTGAVINQAWWGLDSEAGSWVVSRGANVVAVYNQSGWIDYSGPGAKLGLDPTANLTVTLAGATNGYLILEFEKQSSIANNDYVQQ